MSRGSLAAAVVTCPLLFASVTLAQRGPQPHEIEYSDRLLLVKWSDPEQERRARQLPPEYLSELGGRVVWHSEVVQGMAIVEVTPGMSELAETLLPIADEFDFAVRDQIEPARPSIIPNDPKYPQQWSHSRVCMPQAWDVVRHASPSRLIAVIDSGVRYTLPELTSNIAYNTNEQGNDEDNSGVIGDYWGASFDQSFVNDNCANPPNDPWDRCGHGTWMASIIGAVTDNETGISGTIWSGKILPVQIYGQLIATSWAVKGLEYAYKGRGARLMNLSFIISASPALEAFFQQTPDCLYVVAAGNDCVNLDQPIPGDCTPLYAPYPAKYSLEHFIVVSSSDQDDKPEGDGCVACQPFNSGTNYGKQVVDVFAPGLNDWYIGLDGDATNLGGGSSNATAMVTGLAALVWTFNPTFTVAEVKAKILSTTDPIPAFANKCVSGGIINAARALDETTCH